MQGEQKAPRDLDRRIGLRIKARRITLGVSQEDLGKRLGVTFQQVQKYERGLNRVSASRLAEIAAVLETEVQWFYDLSETSLGDEPPAEIQPQTDTLKLLQAYQTLPPEHRKSLYRFVVALASSNTSDAP